jgi:hypothetical protein
MRKHKIRIRKHWETSKSYRNDSSVITPHQRCRYRSAIICTDPNPSMNKQKKEDKPYFYFFSFVSLKTYLQKLWEKKFCWHLVSDSHRRKSRIQIRKSVGTDPRIWIRTKMSRIYNTATHPPKTDYWIFSQRGNFSIVFVSPPSVSDISTMPNTSF